MKRVIVAVTVTAGLGLAAFALVPDGQRSKSSEAADVAAGWVGASPTQPPRRAGDGWEIDVARSDGSLVEVTIGHGLELRGLDEELGPGGSRAHDEITGSLRAEAIRAARVAVPNGRVAGVERDRGGEIEVAIDQPGRTRVEVDLNLRLELTEVEPEQRGDE